MSLDLWFRLVAAAVLVAGMGVSIAYRARAELKGGTAPPRSRGDLPPLGRALAGVVVWGSLLPSLLAPGLVAWARIPLPLELRLMGAVLGGVGVAAIWWTLRSLGTNVSQTTGTRAGATLVTHGPYRWVRHPLYTTGLGLFLSSALMLESGLLLAVVLVVALWAPQRAAHEEEYLIASYGDRYRDYQRHTGRFFPRFVRR